MLVSCTRSLHHRYHTYHLPLLDSTNLFLLALLDVGLGLGSLLPDTDESGVGSGDSQLAVSTTLLTLGQIALLDLFETVLDANTGVDGQDSREFA